MMIQSNNVCKVPCVTNTKLSIKKLDIPWNENAYDVISTYFERLSQDNLYVIGRCAEQNLTGFMYIEDIGIPGPDPTLSIAEYKFWKPNKTNTAVLFLLLSQLYLDQKYKSSWDSLETELATPNKVLSEDVKSSYTTADINKGVGSAFLDSVIDKETTQVGLYNWGPYMPYNTENLYPNSFQMQVYGDLAYQNKKTLNIKIKRFYFDEDRTIGKMYIDSEFFCYTLEDFYPEDGKKEPGKTAIPNGTYNVIVNWSLKFKGYYPLLEDVPDFTGIRIHTGTSEKDTDGCILVGDCTYNEKENKWVWSGNKGYTNYLVQKIREHSNNAKINIGME